MTRPDTPGFELQHPLHENSVSITWKAVQKSLNRPVAIKFFKPEVLGDPVRLANILKVANAVACLKHPNLLQIYDVVSKDDTTFFISECVEGPSALQSLSTKGAFTQPQVLGVARALCSAMALAWKRSGLLHRNLKPSEIFFDSRGVPKIVDFSMAVLDTQSGIQEEDCIIGTPNYLSPEQIGTGGCIDFRADMYSLGATLYHLATGKAPFENLSPEQAIQAQLTSQIVNPRTLNPRITPGLATLLARLMMKAPADRYSDWAELRTALNRLAARKHPDEQPFESSGISTIAPHNGKKRFFFARRPREKPKNKLGRLLLWFLLLAWLIVLGYHRWQSVDSPRAGNPSHNGDTGPIEGTVSSCTL